jgi:DNA invertase Pin-like site-specific DNA recombinase
MGRFMISVRPAFSELATKMFVERVVAGFKKRQRASRI